MFKLFTRKNIGAFFVTEGQNKTTNNNEYLKLLWEVSSKNVGVNHKWLICAKGGDFRKWFGNLEYVINWAPETRAFYRTNHSARIIDEKYWYRDGVTWTDITSSSTAFRYLPQNTTYETKGPTFFSIKPNQQNNILGYLNTKVVKELLKAINPTLSTKITNVRILPIDEQLLDDLTISENTKNLIQNAEFDWHCNETSWNFTNLPLLNPNHHTTNLSTTYTTLRNHWQETTLEMQRLEEETTTSSLKPTALRMNSPRTFPFTRSPSPATPITVMLKARQKKSMKPC